MDKIRIATFIVLLVVCLLSIIDLGDTRLKNLPAVEEVAQNERHF